MIKNLFVVLVLAALAIGNVACGVNAQSAPLSLTDVEMGKWYDLNEVEPKALPVCPTGVVIDFDFADHAMRDQYLCDTDVDGHDTELRVNRVVDRSLAYHQVRFRLISEPTIEGLRASDKGAVLRYELRLRHALSPVRNLRPGHAPRVN